MDIEWMMRAPHPAIMKRSTRETNDKRVYTMRMRPRWKAEDIRLAREFHSNTLHVPYNTAAKMIEDEVWTDIDERITPALLRHIGARRDCLICATTRWNQQPHSGTGTQQYRPGQGCAFDYQGMYSPISRRCTGYIAIMDMGTGYIGVYGVTDKRAVADAMRQWTETMMSYGWKVQEARHDSGSVEIGAEFKSVCAGLGITTIRTPDGIPAYEIERMVQTLQNDIKTILTAAEGLGSRDWMLAAVYAATMRNAISNESSRKIDKRMSPTEIITGKPIQMRQFQRMKLGDVVVSKAAKGTKSITSSKNEAGRVVGIPLDPHEAGWVKSLDGSDEIRRKGHLQKVNMQDKLVQRQEDVRKVTIEKDETGTTTVDINDEEPSTTIQGVIEQQRERGRDEEVQEMRERHTAGRERRSRGRGQLWKQSDRDDVEMRTYFTGLMTEELAEMDEEDIDDVRRQVRYDKERERVMETCMPQWKEQRGLRVSYEQMTSEEKARLTTKEVRMLREYYGYTSEIADVTETDEERDYSSDELSDEKESDDEMYRERVKRMGICRRAFKVRTQRTGDNPTMRMVAESEELQKKWLPVLHENEFKPMLDRILTPRTKEEAEEVGITPHVTDLQTKTSGKLKARINIDGRWEIRRGVFEDRDLLYAPAMNGDLAILLMTYAAWYGMEVSSSDVTQAFTYNEMSEATTKRRIMLHFSEMECGIIGGGYFECNAVSYGTADAAIEWNNNIHKMMTEQGYIQSAYEQCLYIKRIGKNDMVLVGIATDDFLKVSTNSEMAKTEVKRLETAMDNKWLVKHIRRPDNIIGIHIERHDNGDITVTQPATIEKIENSFYPDGRVPVILTSLHPQIEERPEGRVPIMQHDYRKGLGDLQYLRLTRYDVAVALSTLAEYSHTPELVHPDALKWTAAYVINTGKIGVRLRKGPEGWSTSEPIPWAAWSDASWATQRGGYSRYGVVITAAVPGHTTIGTMQGATKAETIREKTIPSESAAAAELMAAVKTGEQLLIYRGIGEEIAGIKPLSPMEIRPHGASSATSIKATMDNDTMREIKTPSNIYIDNESVCKVLKVRNSVKRAKNMKRCGRMLQFMKALKGEKVVELFQVGTKEQKANPMTKANISPTTNAMEVEMIQGSQAAVKEIQQWASSRGRERRPQRLTKRRDQESSDRKEEDNDEELSGDDMKELVKSNTEANTSKEKREVILEKVNTDVHSIILKRQRVEQDRNERDSKRCRN
jgi:hypothetical protein